MARNSIFLSFVFLLLLSISPSLEDDDVKRFVRNHLKSFGYLSGDHTSFDDTYDEALVFSLRKYQTFYGLNVSGRIEPDTLMMMRRPRCGVPDRPLTDKVHNIKLQYAFYPGHPKWTEMRLKYIFITGTPIGWRSVEAAVRSAFSTWSAISRFTFRRVSNFSEWPQLRLGFYSGDHGDGQPFDGRGGVLAHSLSPMGGHLHFDWDEGWGTIQHIYLVDLETVALHEIGHLLGLEHSNERDAVMFPIIKYGQIKRHLHHDDIAGIHALYAH